VASEEDRKNFKIMAHEASIIIPNFDNGCESSVGGATDLLGNLLESIWCSLEDDPTPVEIVIADDGSRDDSLETARAWSRRSWRGGQPFCRLIELEHCGVLSRVLNRLMSETTGRIVCRFDGDIVIQTPRWLERALGFFERFPELGVLGGRQLALDGTLPAVGGLLFHPHGDQHIGAGAPGDAVSGVIEHDHVMGCFQILRRDAFDEIGTYDESMLRGQTVDLGVRLRVAGWRAMTDPELVYEHHLGLRHGRASIGDRPDSVAESRRVFLEKWGFDRLCPDVKAMSARLGDRLVPRTLRREVEDRVGVDEPVALIQNRVGLLRGSIQPGHAVRVMMLGAGDGRIASALATHQIHAALVEDRRWAVESATRSEAGDPNRAVPHWVVDLAELPVQEGLVDVLLIDRALERHPNPIALLREARRILTPKGVLLLLARWRTPEEQIRAPGSTELFTPSSLRSFLANCGFFRSIEFAHRPFPHAEPGVLIYALAPVDDVAVAAGFTPPIGDPVLCT
jgi:glycosyltransferase involved in cell wall biosynthesis